MNEQEYHDLLIRVDERTKQILEQTCKTNGRVTKLEERVNDLESLNDTRTGGNQVKNSFKKNCWELGKLILAAGIGAILGRFK